MEETLCKDMPPPECRSRVSKLEDFYTCQRFEEEMSLLVEISKCQMVRSQRRETQSIRLRTCRKDLIATAGPVMVCTLSWQQPYTCSMVFKGQHLMIVLCNQGTLSLILARKLHSHLNDMQTNNTVAALDLSLT